VDRFVNVSGRGQRGGVSPAKNQNIGGWGTKRNTRQHNGFWELAGEKLKRDSEGLDTQQVLGHSVQEKTKESVGKVSAAWIVVLGGKQDRKNVWKKPMGHGDGPKF